jgi:hypothetical protein
MKSNKPVKGSVCQSDEGHFQLRDNGVHAQQKYGLKRVFFPLGGFNAFSTLLFSGLTAASFLGGGGSTVKGKETLFLGVIRVV